MTYFSIKMCHYVSSAVQNGPTLMSFFLLISLFKRDPMMPHKNRPSKNYIFEEVIILSVKEIL